MWPQTFLGFIPRRKRKIKGFKRGGVVCPTLLECSQPMSMSDCWEICPSYQVLRETVETLFQWKSEFNRSRVFAGVSPEPAAWAGIVANQLQPAEPS